MILGAFRSTYKALIDQGKKNPRIITNISAVSTSRITVAALSSRGFLVNEVPVFGPILVFPHTAFSYKLARSEKITVESLIALKIMNPKPDLVIVGTGGKLKHIPSDAREFLRSIKTNVEVLDTPNACATFNILNEEARNISALLFPE